MTNLKYLIGLVAVLGVITVSYAASAIQPRISNGAVVDTLRRFPHHVTIEPIYSWYNNERPRLCGGSLIKNNWILTSSRCVQDSCRLNLHIQRLHRNDTSGSFTIVVNNDPSNVIVYPTDYDDLSMIKLPVALIESNSLKPINIQRTPVEELKNKLAVLPGFDHSTISTVPPYITTPSSDQSKLKDSLTYAMLSIVSNSVCKNAYTPDAFDEYFNICTRGWGNNRNTPCLTDYGSGLVSDWPAAPKLIGVYAKTSYDCDIGSPAVYINVQKYSTWIDSVIENN